MTICCGLAPIRILVRRVTGTRLDTNLRKTKHSVHTWRMTERDESYGAGLAELMNPDVARNPQPIYTMLQESTPVFRLDGVGVIVTSRTGVR